MDSRLPTKALVVVLSIACFSSFTLGPVSNALASEPIPLQSSQRIPAEPVANPADPITLAADDTFETWPKKPVEPGVEPSATKAGESAGAKTAEGVSAGTVGWILAGIAALGAVILIAAGGSNGTTTTPTTPAH